MEKRKKKSLKKQYQNLAFQKALGEHCRRLRITKGFSSYRIAAESDGLSPSIIMRIEHGTGSVTVANLYRYAEVLEVPMIDLFDFHFDPEKPE